MRPTALLVAVVLVVGCGGGAATPLDAAVDTARPGAGDLEPLTCPDVAGTPETLAEKAARFDEVAQRWHVPAGQDLLFSVHLQADGDTLDKVDMSDNVGSWTALYSASQAFRYAVTRSPAALDNLRRVVRGQHGMLEITGVRGLFTRVFINPTLPGFPTAEQLLANYPDCDLTVAHCKRYNEVTSGPWAGWWFKNDVSKDEYAAHMFTMAVAWEVVDDPDVRAMVADIITAVGDHLVDNRLHLVDIDGKVTTFGEMHAYSMNDYPGFNALLSLSWVRLAAVVGGAKYQDFYDTCMLQRAGRQECIPDEAPAPYTEHLPQMGLGLDCRTNWNNHNMAQLAMYGLLRHENDPALLTEYRRILLSELWDTGDRFPMRVQENSLYTFFYLVNRDPIDAWPADEARTALCALKTFPASKAHHAVDTLSTYTEVCRDRSDRPMTDVVIPPGVREMDNFHWINNPYQMEQSPADPLLIESPEDYLLAYWLGRYYGLITDAM